MSLPLAACVHSDSSPLEHDRELFEPVPSPRRAFVGLAPQTKLQGPQNWNLKHYKSVEFLSILYRTPALKVTLRAGVRYIRTRGGTGR